MNSEAESLAWPKDIGEQPIIRALEAGSFSDEAAQRVAASIGDARIRHATSINGVWSGIDGGELGIIPFENANAGPVWPHLDKIRAGGLRIIGEVHQNICMCVGGREGTTLENATEAISHHKAIEQSSRWLADHAHLTISTSVGSTAEAARIVREDVVSRSVVLGSQLAIDNNGLQTLATDIADSKASTNITNMFVMRSNGHTESFDPEGQHHAAILKVPDYDGSLHDVLGVIRQAAGLTSLHSHNTGHQQYDFFLRMKRRVGEQDSVERFAKMKSVLDVLLGKNNLLWLGSWSNLLPATMKK